jgi:hypothetical protein
MSPELLAVLIIGIAATALVLIAIDQVDRRR